MPPTYKSPPIPTPPATCNAPEVVDVELVPLVILIALVVVAPLPVTLCNVLIFQIVTGPVLVLTAVSVPAVIEVTAEFPIEEVVSTNAPLTVKEPPTYKSLPTPTPPLTINAPELVEVEFVDVLINKV